MKALAMKTLNPSDIAKKLALVASGALLAMFLLTPLGVGASHDDEGRVFPEPTPTSFVLKATTGQSFTFDLVENGKGEMELRHVPAPERVYDFDDD